MYKRLGIFAASVLFSIGAFAQDTPPDFDEVDQDGDGVISKQEAQGAALEQNFQEIDTDKDGEISRTEFELYEQQQELERGGVR